jgi:hypothetical protein
MIVKHKHGLVGQSVYVDPVLDFATPRKPVRLWFRRRRVQVLRKDGEYCAAEDLFHSCLDKKCDQDELIKCCGENWRSGAAECVRASENFKPT